MSDKNVAPSGAKSLDGDSVRKSSRVSVSSASSRHSFALPLDIHDGDDILPVGKLEGEGDISELWELTCKWNGEDFKLEVTPASTLMVVKAQLYSLTGVLPERQKILGIKEKGSVPGASLADLKVKNGQKFRMMGSKEESIAEVTQAAEEAEKDFTVVDDLDWDYTIDDGNELLQDAEAQVALKAAIEKTEIHIMAAPRPNKKLLVLDLDHTLLHFNKDHTGPVSQLKRPHMDRFLSALHEFYDFAVWSQTSWRWLELKLTQLGLLTNPGYHINFVLDKTSMFKIRRVYRKKIREHQVKALEIIWSKFPQWDATNTVHIDDLSRNFAMNPQSGLKCSQYNREDIDTDIELLELGVYLRHIAENVEDFRTLDHNKWRKLLRKLGKKQRKAAKKATVSSPSSEDPPNPPPSASGE